MGKTKFAPFILNNFTLAAVQIALVCKYKTKVVSFCRWSFLDFFSYNFQLKFLKQKAFFLFHSLSFNAVSIVSLFNL